ncbi:hypothetical protein H4582DRAFT_2053770 [Lactarius indigo]|nr:hypothetical protein H4582DRAFT_2053770 [Lactarius indigo]
MRRSMSSMHPITGRQARTLERRPQVPQSSRSWARLRAVQEEREEGRDDVVGDRRDQNACADGTRCILGQEDFVLIHGYQIAPSHYKAQRGKKENCAVKQWGERTLRLCEPNSDSDSVMYNWRYPPLPSNEVLFSHVEQRSCLNDYHRIPRLVALRAIIGLSSLSERFLDPSWLSLVLVGSQNDGHLHSGANGSYQRDENG